MDVTLPVSVYEKDRLAGNQYDTLPRYFVYGGLVFTPLSYDYLKTLGRSSADPANSDLVYELFHRPQESPETTRAEPIVLATVLADEINADVKTRGRTIVDKINGQRIDRLEDVIQAFETNTNAFDVIEFLPDGGVECLDHAGVAKADATLLRSYGITKDRRL